MKRIDNYNEANKTPTICRSHNYSQCEHVPQQISLGKRQNENIPSHYFGNRINVNTISSGSELCITETRTDNV